MDMAGRIDEIVKLEALGDARDRIVQANEQLTRLDERIRTLVREQPVGALLAAAFAGHLLGRLVARR